MVNVETLACACGCGDVIPCNTVPAREGAARGTNDYLLLGKHINDGGLCDSPEVQLHVLPPKQADNHIIVQAATRFVLTVQLTLASYIVDVPRVAGFATQPV